MDLAALLRDPNATPSPMPRSRVGGGGGGKNLRKDASAK